MYTDIQKGEQITVPETISNSISNIFPEVFGAVAGLTFMVSGNLYTAQQSPGEFLCSPNPAFYIAVPSQEDKLQQELQAWDAASDEIHGV